MLQKLSIRNYALIDSLDIEFDKGLNIITGETGAGKSIILGALSLILGQRAESRYFFNQQKKCIIEGTFYVQDLFLQDYFEDLEIDYEAETILRREIAADGKSRAFINDTPVNLNILKQVSEKLIDIHSQHAVLEINDENFQLLTIDSLAGQPDELLKYKKFYKNYKQDLVKLSALENAQLNASKELDYNQFLFKELEEAALNEEEQQLLELELEEQNNAENIKSSLLEAVQLLAESDYAAVSNIKNASARLGQIENFKPEIVMLNERLQSTLIELKDISAEMEVLEQKIHYNAERIDKINARLDIIYSLQQKHRVITNAELLAILDTLSNKLNAYSSADEDLEMLRKSIAAQKATLIELAAKISSGREEVFSKTEQAISTTLRNMGMPNAQLKIKNTRAVDENFDINGLDKINFLFSANAGQAPAPLKQDRFGGELSRFMLSVKSLISTHTALPTIIFDEIDTGISGDVAVKVGRVMQDMAKQMQVIAITHLPQIAARGETHYFVFKEEDNARTLTGIRKLTKKERVEVIAELLSGRNPGASAIQNAAELLG